MHVSNENSENWDLNAFLAELNAIFPMPTSLSKDNMSNMSTQEIEDQLQEFAEALYEEKEHQTGSEEMRTLERLVMLRTIDSHWVQHLTAMENLRQGIGLHAFGQRDPLVMFKREGHEMFQNLMSNIQHDIVHTVFRVGLVTQPGARRIQKPQSKETAVSVVAGRDRQEQGDVVGKGKVGRNEACPCGSGKKYKRCHGAAA